MKILKRFLTLDGFDHNLKYYILNGILFTLMTTFSKSYALKFLDRIGGNSLHFSLFNALPGFIAIFATLPGIIIMSNTLNKKKIMGGFFLASRIFTFLFIFIPFLPMTFQPMAFVVLTSLMNFPDSISVTALQGYSGDIFLPKERANAISLRNKFSTLAQVISMLFIGLLLRLPKDNASSIKIYQGLFVLAFLVGLIEIHSFFKLKEKNITISKEKLSLLSTCKDVFKNKNYKSFIVCSILFHFGWQMGWPLFSIYQISILGADELWLTILNITSNLVMAFSFSYWNNLIKRKGCSFTISIASLGMSITPILFALSPNLYIMTLTGLITGFFTSGTVTVILSSLLEVSSEKNRMLCVAFHGTLTNITLAFSPILSNIFLNKYNIYMALIITACFRLIGSISFFIRNKKINIAN